MIWSIVFEANTTETNLIVKPVSVCIFKELSIVRVVTHKTFLLAILRYCDKKILQH